VEAMVNSRPLTYVYNDVGSPQIIRPSDLITPQGTTGLKPMSFDIGERTDPNYKTGVISTTDQVIDLYKKNEQR
jgi:hypothetical protein